MRAWLKQNRAVVVLWICAALTSAAWGAGDHTDIERRVRQTLQSLPGSLPPSKLDPAASNQCLCGAAVAGPSAPPMYRPLTLNDIPPGSPPGPHGITHETGGIDQLSVNAPTAPNRVYASPTSGAAGPPTYRPLVEADLPTAPQNYALAGPTSGGAGAPVYRPLQPADLSQAPANSILAGPSSGGMGPVTYRPLAAADVVGVAAPMTHASTHLPGGADALTTAAPATVTGTSNSTGVAASFARSDHLHALGTHASTHLPSGADALTTAAPSTVSGTSNSTGSANSYARSDHLHALSYGTPVTTSTANANGSSNSVARSDHVHALGAHASTHLPGGADALTTAAPTTPSGTSNTVGVAASFARSDHLHALPYATPVATGAANAAGSSNNIPRSDHVHATTLPSGAAFGWVWVNPVAGSTTGLSTALAANDASNTATGLVSPDVYRLVQITLGVGWDGGTCTFTGTKFDGAVVTVARGIAGTTVSTDPWLTVTSGSKTAVGASAATCTLGPDLRLGIPSGNRWMKQAGAILTVNNVLDAITAIANGGSDTYFYSASTPNGARTYVGTFFNGGP